MNHVIRISETGGPEVMQWETQEVASPGPSEILLRQTAVGLNYI
ncbi:MAG: quinone oxidoreductase, partial [Pseudomonadota bacterium]|nr:quinone oxidoreductase [Pseudomonadota bacterium]